MLMIWAVANVHFEPGVYSCSPEEAVFHLSIRFRAQLVAFQTRLCSTGFLTVLELERLIVMAVPGNYPAVAPRATAIF
jgi:hypothetical protein